MSETDSFIEEVTEEVRRDRLFAFFRRFGWILVLAIILIVGYAAWTEWQKSQFEASARVFGEKIATAQAESDPTARLKALEAIQASGVRSAVLGLLVADQAVAAGQPKVAETQLQSVASDKSLPVSYRVLAALKRVIIAGDTMPAADREAALTDLLQAGRPYRPLALEQIALIAVAKGDTKGAIKQFHAILQEPELTAGLRQRATEMIVALGGDLAAS